MEVYGYSSRAKYSSAVLSPPSPSVFRSFYRRLFHRNIPVAFYSLPVTPVVEHREVSRRPVQQIDFDVWAEPDSRPVFTFKLRPRLIQEGNAVKLICCVTGKPMPKVQWFKERTQLSDTDSHYLTSDVHGVCELEITSAELFDTATYRCYASNPLGTDETSCFMHVEEVRRTRRARSAHPGGETSRDVSQARSPSPARGSGRDASWREKLGAGEKPAQRDTLEVEKPKRKERRDPPKFSEQLVDITVFEGATAKLRCEVKGRPTPKIEWLKNGELLAAESRIQEAYEDDVATLVIKKVKIEDGGEYICRATNDEGSDTSSAQVTVKPHVPGENEEAYEASLAHEDEPSLQGTQEPTAAVPEPTEGAASETAAKVEEKLPSEAVAEVPESAAISTEPTPVEAPVGTEPEPTPAAEPEPEPAPAPAPEPAKPAAGKAAPAKKAAVPEKKPAGQSALKKPEPAKKTEEKKEPAKKPAAEEKIKTEEAKPAAAAPPPPAEEAPAPPPAEPEKKKEEEEEKAEEKPAEPKLQFSKYIKSQNLMEGDSLTLECTVENVPEDVQIVWLRNGKEIPDNPDFRRERDGNNFKLVVAEVFPEDSGVFSASLKTAAASEDLLSSCSVIIQARDEEPLDPSFLEFPQSVNTEEGSKAKFNCKLSGSTPMTAEWSLNGKSLDAESSRLTFSNAESEFALEIPVVLLTDQGQYNVKISNDKGEITAAFSLHVNQ